MNLADTLRSFASGAIDVNQRPVTLNWGKAQGALGNVIALQHADIHEALMSGINGHLTCVSSRDDLPPKMFMGLPVSVRLTTDREQLHAINAIVTDVQVGQSDGDLCCYQLTVTDALSLMDKRVNSRVFRQKSLVDILTAFKREWQQRSPAFARAFDFDVSGLDTKLYPAREITRQVNESDARFIRRLLRREGVTVFAKAGQPKDNGGQASDTPMHTLVFCDDPMKLSECSAGTIRYHQRNAGTEERDTITLFALKQSLIPGRTARPSWDYKPATMHQSELTTSVDQGDAGNDLAGLLADVAIDIPHAGDSWDDHDRMTRDRMLAHEFHAQRVDAVSAVRDLAVGFWFTLTGQPHLDSLSADHRQFMVTSLHHQVSNNLPEGVTQQAQALFAASRNFAGGAPSSPATSTQQTSKPDTRYENTFTCVQRGVPLTPAYDPKIDLPPVHPFTALVVGPDGEEVFCDEFGRIRVQMQGLDEADHTHAQGAGTNGNPSDSAPVRVLWGMAGPNFGDHDLPRIGMEVLLDHIGGDPDRLVVVGVLPNGKNMPATFSHTGSLPGNRYLSGTKTKEVKAQRYNQLRFDNTPGQISSQLASEHGYSQLNLGYLTQPRDNGNGEARGEGAELRSDASVAIRSGKAMLISAWEKVKAGDAHLARDEYLQLMQDCLELFKSLGDYAGQHQGVAMDTQPHTDLVSTVKGWPNGAASGGASGASQAAIGITSPAGVSVATPKSVATYAGGNVDTVAQNHLQYTSGQRINMQAGHSVNLFAQSEGISAIANQGKVKLQSQADDTQIDSAKNIQFTAAGGKLVGMASDQVVFVTSGGAYLKLQGANIELGCPGSFIVKSASHNWSGPASMSTDMPKFDHAPLGRVPKLVRATDGQPAPGFDAEVKKASGDLLNQKTDSAGKLSPVNSDQFEKLAVQFVKKNV
ncbi:type VI secretion system Vgr family protein [Paraburkholderia megapolitana]|uniref:Rhs element Vgr protein n=1 Tax=Paraburkholderia megapolitana TaxID=420953 RepID=A0A1I3VCY7_9BURK|nr:type VI secretion system Vgr family protein [Paraburkholderia megapolitana]QDQ85493.1 type VI secretion system tip protein VgrG [Paraburkholderia megapolitana]SFJ92863.1 Rhs element Vgr protein [Paraburkholderia megapolitana]